MLIPPKSDVPLHASEMTSPVGLLLDAFPSSSPASELLLTMGSLDATNKLFEGSLSHQHQHLMDKHDKPSPPTGRHNPFFLF